VSVPIYLFCTVGTRFLKHFLASQWKLLITIFFCGRWILLEKWSLTCGIQSRTHSLSIAIYSVVCAHRQSSHFTIDFFFLTPYVLRENRKTILSHNRWIHMVLNALTYYSRNQWRTRIFVIRAGIILKRLYLFIIYTTK